MAPHPSGQPPPAGAQHRWPHQTLLAAAEHGPVFVKDFPAYVDHMWTDAFLADFNHSFLIRDPAKVLPSVYKHWDHFVAQEIGFDTQRRLRTATVSTPRGARPATSPANPTGSRTCTQRRSPTTNISIGTA